MYVICGGMHLMMDASSMAELGWIDGQTIAVDQQREAIKANARSLLRTMDRNGMELSAPLVSLSGYTPTA